jgi:hypothetical protein
MGDTRGFSVSRGYPDVPVEIPAWHLSPLSPKAPTR